MGGGKSELQRAGWSVIRTAPPCEIGVADISQGGIRKVPQKGYRLPRYAGSDELRVKSYEFITPYSELLTPNFGG